ncbi:MAG: hypothetical protein ACYC0M_10470 [Burkholderiales bacterium]
MATNEPDEASLTCCVCGGDAGRCQQHWNRDSGYGICPSCVVEECARHTPDVIESCYGKPGVNYDQPMVRYFGRRYKVLAAIKNEGQANAFMERTPNAVVLTVFDDGMIIIADKSDKGEPIQA